MASIISAGNATNGLAISSDNTGILQLKTGTGSGTTAITVDASQNATFAAAVTATTSVSTPIVKSTTTSPPTIQNSAGTEIGTLCRAWVNFNGVTTVTIGASFNITSVTRSSSGTYTLNFTNALPDTKYIPVFGLNSWGTGGSPLVAAGVQLISAATSSTPNNKTTSALTITTGVTNSNTISDAGEVNVAIFR